MTLNRLDPTPIPDTDESTVFPASTPPESVASDFLDDHDPLSAAQSSSSAVPWPGSTFIIRCVSSGQVLTLREGQIVLAQLGGHGYMHWACVESKGWLGFRDVGSGRFLGHDIKGKLCCSAERHQGWENFCARMTPEGGYVLLMTHFERLWHVGIKVDQGVEKLAKVGDGTSAGLVWEFIKV